MVDKDFIYYIIVWAIAYAEAINEGVYLPVPDLGEFDSEDLQSILVRLETHHPDVSFNYGLGEQDLLHNAKATQILSVLDKVNCRLQEIDKAIRPTDKLTILLEKKLTPVKLGPYLRSFLRHLKPIPPNFRLGGTNGELTVLKLATGVTSLKTLTKCWLRNVKSKLDFLEAYPEVQILHPTNKQNLPVVSTHERNILSGMSVAGNLKGLTQVLLQHRTRGLMDVVNYAQEEFWPLGFENTLKQLPGRCFVCYNTFSGLYEKSLDIYLPPNDSMYLYAWELLYDVVGSILDVLNFVVYDRGKILAELASQPECLTELLSYYSSEPPVGNFEDKIAMMDDWEIL